MCRLDFSFNVSETDLAGNLFVCNEGLFWFSESCLNYIMFELYSYVSLKTRAKKTNKKIIFLPWSLAFQTQPPQLPLHLSLSLSPQLSLRPSVPFSPTPPSHITPLITPQWEANLRECECCACANVIGAAAHQCFTNPLSIFNSALLVGSQINQTNWTLEPEYLIFHWIKREESMSKRHL